MKSFNQTLTKLFVLINSERLIDQSKGWNSIHKEEKKNL
jgi:hypothetical protein